MVDVSMQIPLNRSGSFKNVQKISPGQNHERPEGFAGWS